MGCGYCHGLGTIRDYSNGRRGQTVTCPRCAGGGGK